MRGRMLKVGSVYELVDWHMKLFKSSDHDDRTKSEKPIPLRSAPTTISTLSRLKVQGSLCEVTQTSQMHDLYMHEFFGFSYSHWNAAQRHILRGFQVVRINPDFFTPPEQCQICPAGSLTLSGSRQSLQLVRDTEKKTAKSNETFETFEVETWEDFWDARFVFQFFEWFHHILFEISVDGSTMAGIDL